MDRWTASAKDVPIDVWIESIPFRETRGYVQNVLAFSQVYAGQLSLATPTLHPGELLVQSRAALQAGNAGP